MGLRGRRGQEGWERGRGVGGDGEGADAKVARRRRRGDLEPAHALQLSRRVHSRRLAVRRRRLLAL
jgi:hypothetical protein